MRNVVRWTVFTIAVTLVGLAIAFGYMFLGRLYGGMQEPAFVFIVLVLYSIGVTIAAIKFTTKLEEEEWREEEAGPPLPPRRATHRESSEG